MWVRAHGLVHHFLAIANGSVPSTSVPPAWSAWDELNTRYPFDTLGWEPARQAAALEMTCMASVALTQTHGHVILHAEIDPTGMPRVLWGHSCVCMCVFVYLCFSSYLFLHAHA